MTVRVPLYQKGGIVRAYAVVDDADAFVLAGRWSLNHGYAMGRLNQRRRILLHRLILGLDYGDGKIVDHINRDRLDCRRENMRITDRVGSNRNRKRYRNNTSGYQGVCRLKNRWQAWCCKQYLGLFATPEEAAVVAAAKRKELGFLDSEVAA